MIGFGDDNPGLNKTCAQLVQALHVDVRLFGTLKRMGHVDFYANSLAVWQPGCLDDICSHLKSVFFNYASLFHEYEFVGRDCKRFSGKTSRFGPFNDGKEEGSFCFETTACFPYASPNVPIMQFGNF